MVHAGELPDNLVLLVGRCSSAPSRRRLATGEHVEQATIVTVAADGVSRSVGVVADAATRGAFVVDLELVVLGRVRQRFFRSGSTTATRTEVVAAHIVPRRRRREVSRLVEEVRRSLGGE